MTNISSEKDSFFDFFHQAPLAIFVVENGNIVEINKAVLKLLGGLGTKEILNRGIREVLDVPSSENNNVPENFESSIKIGKEAGRKITISHMPLPGRKGRHLFIVSPEAVDVIVGQEQLTDVDKDQEIDRFKFMLESSPDVIMEFDASFKHLYVNKKVKDITGIPASEYLGKTHQEMGYPEELVGIFDDALSEVFRSGKENRVEFRLPNGCEIDWVLVPQRDIQGNVSTVMATARDITALKKTELALRDSQGKLLEAMKLATLAFWVYDLSEELIHLKEDFGVLLGERWLEPREIPIHEYISTFIHPDDQQMVKDAWKKAATSKYSATENTMEYRLQRKDGHVIKVFNIILLEYDSNGTPLKCEGIIQDISLLRITQEKLQEYHSNLQKIVASRTEQLKRSEARLSDALKLAKLSTWEFNFTTKKYYGDGTMAELLKPKDKEEGLNIIEVPVFENLIHPDDLPVYHQSFQRALKSDSEDYLDYIEYRIIMPDGELKYLYLSIKIEIGSNGRHLRHYGTIQDITSFRKAEEERERLTSIIEVTPDIVAILDPTGKIIYLNQSGRYFYGFLEQEDITQINFMDMQKDTAKDLLKTVGFPNARKDGIWTGEGELMGRNGQNVPVSLSIVAHYGQEGIINSYSTIIRNISTQKKTEQDLIYKNTELDTFVYRASHDLRGPISSLLGLYQIVQYEVKDPKSLEFFDMFNKQILRLNEIILALINLTKIKDTAAVQTPISFTSIVNDAIDSLRHLKEFSHVKFKVKVNVKVEFKSDKGLITTIIQNLIENGIKYSRKTDYSYVHVTITSNSQKMVIIKVEDNGIGIAKDIQYRIFDMFFRGNEISKGSGLGLYILKNAVEKIHGKIHLESEVSVGTTFTIEIPVLD